ncbi:MAG: hypothetical protein KDB04_06440 [Acidimicrobiales bacterium]|nr:hypothetical protein [Acidimicrobiales bacterium]
MGLRARRAVVVSLAIGAAVLGGAGLARADGGVRISPASGPEGSSYDIDVDCATPPALANAHTQDGPDQGTIAAFVPDDVTEVAPSTWRVTRQAGTTDEIWWAECDGTNVGQDRFDAESPHLWFGPRPFCCFSPLVGRTTVEGTDCPAGTTPTVEVLVDGLDIIYVSQPSIDEHGDWTVELPKPVGDLAMTVRASCGDVTYAELRATTTSTSSTSSSTSSSTTSSTTTSTPAAGPSPATPVRTEPGYTG